MQVSVFNTPVDAKRWDEFVDSSPDATNYHRWEWKQLMEGVFGWPTIYLAAEDGGRISGILPVVLIGHRLNCRLFCSMPFLGECGIASSSEMAKRLLLDHAIKQAQGEGVDYMELRHRHDQQLGLPAKTDKVRVVLPLGSETEKIWMALNTKLRTKIRKAINAGLTAEFGGLEFVGDFYRIFAQNMRDLGTPVYSEEFFVRILTSFPHETFICRVQLQGRTVAASFLMGFRDTLEAKWTSSLREYLPMKSNLFLYWNLFCFAVQHKYKVFDFGRSTVGSGTHVFKTQWSGTHSIPLHWDYWLPNGNRLPERNPGNPKYRMAIQTWRRLPVSVTRILGPRFVRYFP